MWVVVWVTLLQVATLLGLVAALAHSSVLFPWVLWPTPLACAMPWMLIILRRS